MYEEMHAKDETEYAENSNNLKNAEIELNFVQNKVDRLEASYCLINKYYREGIEIVKRFLIKNVTEAW